MANIKKNKNDLIQFLVWLIIILVVVLVTIGAWKAKRWINWKLSYGTKVEKRIEQLEKRVEKLEKGLR